MKPVAWAYIGFWVATFFVGMKFLSLSLLECTGLYLAFIAVIWALGFMFLGFVKTWESFSLFLNPKAQKSTGTSSK